MGSSLEGTGIGGPEDASFQVEEAKRQADERERQGITPEIQRSLSTLRDRLSQTRESGSAADISAAIVGNCSPALDFLEKTNDYETYLGKLTPDKEAYLAELKAIKKIIEEGIQEMKQEAARTTALAKIEAFEKDKRFLGIPSEIKDKKQLTELKEAAQTLLAAAENGKDPINGDIRELAKWIIDTPDIK
ncbi:MAG: hypothetical protein WC768_01390 [Patescibacteria group bacterium]|jgi:hypothetical protein